MRSTRALLGIISVAVAIAAGVLWLVLDETTAAGVAARLSLMLGAVWIAWPSLSRVSWRNTLIVAGVLVVIVLRPRSALVILPVLALTMGSERRTTKTRK